MRNLSTTLARSSRAQWLMVTCGMGIALTLVACSSGTPASDSQSDQSGVAADPAGQHPPTSGADVDSSSPAGDVTHGEEIDDEAVPLAEFTGFDVGLTYLDQLDALHRRMIDEDLVLRIIDLVAVYSSDDGRLVLRLGSTDSVGWSPPGTDRGVQPFPVEARLSDVPETISGLVIDAAPSQALVVFNASGEIAAIGFLESDGSSFVELDAIDAPLFVGDAATWLHAHQFDPVPKLDPCQPDGATATASTPLEAITSYFEDLGGTLRSDLTQAVLFVNNTADQLLRNAPTFVDPVTGDIVSPAANDLSVQLRRGVATTDIVYRGALPVGIIIPQKAAPGGEAVFLGSDSGFLGAALLQPSHAVDEAGKIVETFYETTLYITPPSPGEDVEVYERSSGDSQWLCPAGATEAALLTIPYDDIAGSGRVRVDVENGTYSDLNG